MTKIYEALRNAGRERADAEPADATPVPVTGPPPKALEEKLLALYRRIEALVDEPRGKVVGFAGATSAGDSSHLLCEFAKVAAERLRRKVLLAAPYPSPHSGPLYWYAGEHGWEEAVLEGSPFDNFTCPVGHTGVSVSHMSRSDTALPGVLASKELPVMLDALRERFDLVVIDAPPLNAGSDAALLSSVVDGVVLVVEAGRARWQAVRSGMEQIAAQGGTVLGVVLNRRRRYIPECIYRRL